ncbi:hypothetical protein JW835_07880 [bacterium]|nr:hypothetical protein [bacterium]
MKILRDAVLLLFLLGQVIYAEENLQKLPGYVDLDDLKLSKIADEVGKLHIPRFTVTDDNGETTNISVYLKYYKVHEECEDKLQKAIEKLDKILNRKKWIRIVHTESKDDYMSIRMCFDKDTNKCLGLMMVSMDSGCDDVGFINIAGSVSLKGIQNLDIPVDEDVMDSLEHAVEYVCTEDDE